MTTEVNGVSISIRLALDQLLRDTQQASELIRSRVKDVDLKFNTAKAQQELGGLSVKILEAKAALASVNERAGLQQQAALLQESLRYKQELANIENAGFSDEDVANAKALAAELNRLNLEQIDQTAARSTGLTGRLNQFQQAITEASLYTQALREVGQQLTQTGQQINAFTSQSLAAATAFDDARAKVATLSDNADGFALQMQELSKELNFQVNSTELLNASYDVLSSGFSDAADVANILKASALGAQGGFSDIGTVADATTTILNSYKLTADDAARVVDVLAQTQDKGKITIDQYAASVGRAASIAATAGVSFEEFSAAIATATAKGVPAESAISGTRQAIVNLLKPTTEAQKLLEQFGIQNATAALKSEGLIGILQQLKEQGATSDQLSKIFSDVDALATVATLAGENLGDFQANLDAMSNSAGKASNSAQEVANSFSGQVTAALNQSNEALVSLGKGVQNAVIPLLQGLTFLIQNFNKLPEPVKQATGQVLALTGGAITLAGALAGIAAVVPAINAGFQILTGGTLLNTGATTANTAAKLANAAANGQVAASSGAATVATNAQTAATQLSTAALGQMAVKGLAVGAAIASISLAVDTFSVIQGAAANTQQNIDSLRQTLAELNAEQARTGGVAEQAAAGLNVQDEAARRFREGLNPVQQLLENIREGLSKLPEPLQKILLGLPGLATGTNEFATATEAAANKQAVAFGDLVGNLEGVLGSYQQFTQSGDRSAEAVERQRKAIQAAQQALEATQPTDQASIVAKEQYTAALKRAEEQLNRISPAANGAQQGVQDLGQATEDQISGLDRLSAAQEQQTQRLEQGNKLRQAEIAESVAQGLITEDEGRQQNLQAEQQYQQQRLAVAQQALQDLKALQASTTDPKELEKVNQEVLQAESTVADARLAVAQNLTQQLEAQNQKRLQDLERANAQAEAAIERSQNERTVAVREAQLAGTISAEQATREIEAIERDAIAQTIAQKQEEFAQIDQLRREGLLTVEEAADREISLSQEIGRLNLQRIEAELEARKRLAEEMVQQQFEQPILQAQATVGNLSTQGQIRQGDLDLLNAQVGLQETLSGIEQQRLEFQIRAAEVAGNSSTAEKLRGQLYEQQIGALEQQYQSQLAAQQVSEQIKAIELERNLAQAELNQLKAEEAVQLARARGESEATIRQLEQERDFANQGVQLADQAIARQQQLNQLGRDRLNAQFEQNRAQAEQNRQLDEAQRKQERINSLVSALTASSSQPDEDQTRQNLQQIQNRFQLARRNGLVSQEESQQFQAAFSSVRSSVGRSDDALLRSALRNQNNPFFSELLQASGRGDIAQLAGLRDQGPSMADSLREANQGIETRLDDLNKNILQLASSPRSLSVSTPDPVADVGKILAEQSARRMKGVGL